MIFPIFLIACAVGVCTGATVWVYIRRMKFVVQPDTLWHATQQFWDVLNDVQSRIWAWIPLGIGVTSFVIFLIIVSDSIAPGHRHQRGSTLVQSKSLRRLTQGQRKNGPQVTLAGVPVPIEAETTHFLMVGSTGTGKSNAQSELIAGAMARGDRVVVIDPNGEALSRYLKDGDRVLNPFDSRGEGWSIFNEIRSQSDYDLVARSVIPGSAGEDETWRAKARIFLSDLIKELMASGKVTSAQGLLWWAAEAPRDQLQVLLAGTSTAALLQPDAGRLLDSVRGILSGYLSAHSTHPTGEFSIKQWHIHENGNLYLTWRDDQTAALRPLINCWANVLISAVLSNSPSARPLWLFVDELGSLEQLGSLESALTKGRKRGLRVVACLQSTSQLTALYGRATAETLRSCFRTLLVLGGSATDPDTAEAMSRGLGDYETNVLSVSVSRDGDRRTTSESQQLRIQRLVMAAQIQSLPINCGYLKFPGDLPVAKVQVRLPVAPTKFQPFKAR